MARYCARNPLALERLTYDRAAKTVTYRLDKAEGPTAGTETLDPRAFLARVLVHIPDKGQVTTRYYGWYAPAGTGIDGLTALGADEGVGRTPSRLKRKAFGVRAGEWPLSANGFERREGPEPDRVPPMGLGGSAALFGAGALLLFLTTRVAVPAFVSATGAETVVMWFLAASIVLFGPLLLTAALLLYRERRPGRLGSLGARLWLRPMNGADWLWAVGGLAAVVALTGGIGVALRMLQDGKNFRPSFMAFEPLGPGRY